MWYPNVSVAPGLGDIRPQSIREGHLSCAKFCGVQSSEADLAWLAILPPASYAQLTEHPKHGS